MKQNDESIIEKLIPNTLNTFLKLTEGDPYHFDRWEDDSSSARCMYYWFNLRNGNKIKKRVLASEFHSARKQFLTTGTFNRNNYRTCCPSSNSSGGCGFAVMGRILEALDNAVYSGRQKGFVRANSHLA